HTQVFLKDIEEAAEEGHHAVRGELVQQMSQALQYGRDGTQRVGPQAVDERLYRTHKWLKDIPELAIGKAQLFFQAGKEITQRMGGLLAHDGQGGRGRL